MNAVEIEEAVSELASQPFDRNLWTAIWCSYYALPVMKQAGHSRIVNIGADSVRNGLADHAGYNAAKGGMHGMTSGLAVNLPATGLLSIQSRPALFARLNTMRSRR